MTMGKVYHYVQVWTMTMGIGLYVCQVNRIIPSATRPRFPPTKELK